MKIGDFIAIMVMFLAVIGLWSVSENSLRLLQISTDFTILLFAFLLLLIVMFISITDPPETNTNEDIKSEKPLEKKVETSTTLICNNKCRTCKDYSCLNAFRSDSEESYG